VNETMKPLVIFHTRTQNTPKVAEAIAEALEADLLTAEQVTAAALEGRRLVGLGSGVYWTRLDPRIYDVARQLPRDAKVFTFATSGFQHRLFINLYRSRIERAMARRGIVPVGHWHCPGQDRHFLTRSFGLSKDRPSARDLDEARAFATRIAEQCAVSSAGNG
jgi:flavodoxin